MVKHNTFKLIELLQGKYFAIQLVLLVCKLQPIIVNSILQFIDFKDRQYPITPRVIANSKP